MEAVVYNKEGKEAGKVSLPEVLFNVPWNGDLVHQVVMSMEGNARTPVAHTKIRSEVSGTGKKPWRQKGTGQARHGSRRSPIWKGGGVAHGPRNERDYSRKINKSMRRKALAAVLSQKLRDNEVLFVEDFGLSAPKAKDAKAAIKALATIKGYEKLGTKRKNAAVIALSGRDENAEKSFRNFSNVTVDEVRNLNPVALLRHTYLVVVKPSESVKVLEERGVKNAAK
jgi:large subunit ribosomal protein L4